MRELLPSPELIQANLRPLPLPDGVKCLDMCLWGVPYRTVSMYYEDLKVWWPPLPGQVLVIVRSGWMVVPAQRELARGVKFPPLVANMEFGFDRVPEMLSYLDLPTTVELFSTSDIDPGDKYAWERYRIYYGRRA